MSEQIPNKKFTIKDAFLAFTEWYRYFLTKWILIVIVGLLGAALGFGYAYMQKPVYKASLSFAIESGEQDGLGGALSLASQFGFDFGGSAGGMFASANLMELFKSRRMVEQTLLMPSKTNAAVSYAEMFIQGQQWRARWAEKPELKSLQFLPGSDRSKYTRAQDSVMGVIYSMVSKTNLNVFQKDKKVDIITIETKSGDENFAKEFTEALAQHVSDFYIDTKNKKARINMAILERQRDSVRSALNSAITGVAAATDNTFGLNPALNVQRTPATKRQVDVEYNAAILTELIKQTELAKLALQKETPLIEVIDKPVLPLPKEKLGKLMGLIIGGILGGIIILGILIVRRLYKLWLT